MCAQTTKQSITIKKYANRRLYNTATSSYVTLDDLSVMVKEGQDFNVYDAKTSEDITRSVLTQIIVEEENKADQQNLLPINFLRQLISFYGDNLQWMVPKYLEHSMEMLTGNQDQIRDYFQTSLGNLFPFGTTLEEMSKQNMSMFENTMRMFSPMTSLDILTGSFPTGNFPGVSSAPASSNADSSNKASCCATTAKSDKNKDKASCCASSSNDSCETNTKNSAKNEAAAQETTTSASVTSLKPRNNNEATATTTPMPNVQSVTNTSSGGADDMQQKIANLQRQLADLAKSRA